MKPFACGVKDILQAVRYSAGVLGLFGWIHAREHTPKLNQYFEQKNWRTARVKKRRAGTEEMQSWELRAKLRKAMAKTGTVTSATDDS